MRTKLFFIMTSLCLLLSGCAHHLMRGSVAMKTGDSEAHVCMGKGEVKVGDRVAVFKNNCRPKTAGSCEKVRTGEGTVTQVLNEHYSVVTFDPGVPFDEGTFVEKL